MASAAAVGTVAGGVFTNLLSSGLQRSGSMMFQKITRLKRVDKAIKEITVTDSHVRQCLTDLETVLGTYQGKLTTTLDAFLKEVQRTGIIEVMIENALIGRTSEQTLSAFLEVYHRFFDTDLNEAANIYRKISSAFRASLSHLARDPVLLHAITIQQRDLAARLDNIDSALAEFSRESQCSQFPDDADLTATFVKIARALQNTYKTVRIETIRSPRDVDINQIYIAPKLRTRMTSRFQRKAASFARGLEDSQLATLRLSSHPNRRLAEASIIRSPNFVEFSYSEIQKSFRRIVVLGDPGGGKSTFCQKMCYDLAKQALWGAQFGEKRIAPADQKLPIRVIIRWFEQALSRDPQLDLLTYISRDLVQITSEPLDKILPAVRYLLKTGRVILAFDGLDEILDTSNRQKFVDLVDAFTEAFPLCPTLVTSRLVGYDDTRLPDTFEEFTLTRFEEKEVRDYVVKFMKVVGEFDADESSSRADKFIEQTKTTAQDLRRNPLMLGLMTWLFLNSGDVPTNRPEIYKECSILMFERWDQKRGIRADANSDFDRTELFTYLASRIYGDPALSAGVNRAWLSETLEEKFSTLFQDRARCLESTKRFVDFITGRAWVMSEVGDAVFAFTHQTFLEYFFARDLNDRHETVASLLRALKRRIVKYEWNEVAHLSLQIKTYRSLRKQEDTLEKLWEFVEAAKVQKHRSALAVFASKALEYLSPSEFALERFLRRLFAGGLSGAQAGDPVMLHAFAEATYVPHDRRDFVEEIAANLIKDELISGDFKTLRTLQEGLLGNNESYRYAQGRGSVPLREIVSPEARSAVAERTLTELSRRNANSEYHAGLRYALTCELQVEPMVQFGVAPFFNAAPVSGIPQLDGLTVLPLISAERIIQQEGSNISKAAADSSLRALLVAVTSGARIEISKFDTRSKPLRIMDEMWRAIYSEMKDDQIVAASILIRNITSFVKTKDSSPKYARTSANDGPALAEAEFKILENLKIPAEDKLRIRSFVVREPDLFETTLELNIVP